ncbi:hypothetical protein [Nocardioides sp. NPDC127503]|uniref:hypothetical protein n=1 Tax=Nocardioides sp. NPDC127503 TaxID=3154516 RepID=UPI00332B2743
MWANELDANIHVAIMTEPYLSKVRSGEKYIESRLTKVNISPFRRAAEGDIVLFKRSGGAILAMALIERVEFEHLTAPDGPASLAEKYADGLGYEPGYVETKQHAKFASLLWLREVRDLPATPLEKRGRQAWVTLHAGHQCDSAKFDPSSMLF